MPTLTGTLAEITGKPIDPDSLHQVTVRAPSRRASLADQSRLVASVAVPVEVSPTGEISVELEPGPAVMLVEGEGLRDVYELGVTADMTLLTEALQEMSPTRSWVESQMVQLRTEAVAAAAAAAEDREQTGLDRVATGEDRAQTGLDRVATGEDRVATGEDRTQTGLDRVEAEKARGDAVDAAGDVAAAVAQFDVDFAADMTQFASIRDEMNLLATDVALDANRAEAAANEFYLTASSSTLAPGAAATVTVSGDGPAYSLAFGVPQGEKGDKGDEGEISQAQLDAAVASLVDNAPEALNTLSELSTALGDDPNFATTVSTQIGERAKTSDVNAALADKADKTDARFTDARTPTAHNHPVSDLTATGTPSSSTYLRGDGSWATPTNTTYSVPTQAEAEAGTATTGRAFSAQRVAQGAIAASGKKDWQGTQAEYDALPTKDADRTYWIV